ncbi:hypothetical protein TNCV_2120541, partial [Trichonephila clavipes]
GLGSNPWEDMDVYECMVPVQQGSTLNIRPAEGGSSRVAVAMESSENYGGIPKNWG